MFLTMFGRMLLILRFLGLLSLGLASPLSSRWPLSNHHRQSIGHGNAAPNYPARDGSSYGNKTGVNTEYGPDGEKLLELQSLGWDSVSDALEAQDPNATCTKNNIVKRTEW